MSTEFIRRKSAELFKKECEGRNSQPVSKTETTPEAIDANIVEFCILLGTLVPIRVPVVADSYGLFGYCSDGVKDKVIKDEGDIVFGWIIWQKMDLYLTAEFHAVWKNKNGQLIDITPKPDRETSIVFAQDESYPPDFDFINRPKNRRKRIYQEGSIGTYVEQRIASLTVTQLEYEKKRALKKGLSLSSWLALKKPVDEKMQSIEYFLSCCDKVESYLKVTRDGSYITENDYEHWKRALNSKDLAWKKLVKYL